MTNLLVKRFGRMRLNLLSSTLGYMGYGAAQWAMVIALARLTTPAAVGQFTLAFAITAPVFLTLDMQLRRIVASDVTNRLAPRTMLSVRIGSCALSTLAVVLLSVCLHQSRTQFELNLLVALAKSFESISDLLYGYFQRLERMHSIAISLLLKGSGALVGLAVAASKTGSIVYATAAIAGWWLLLLLLFDAPRVWRILRRSGEHGQTEPSITSWWPLVRMAGPLGISLVIGSLGSNIPRYVLEARRGQAELGVYAAASYFFVIGARLASATSDTILPRLSKIARTDLGAFRRLLWKAILPIVAFSIVLAGAAIPLGRPILIRLYGQAYGAGATIIVIVFLASSVNCIFNVFQAALMALRQINVQVVTVSAGAIVALLVCAALVNRLGGVGAAIALVAGLAVQATLSGAATFVAIHKLERSETPTGAMAIALNRLDPQRIERTRRDRTWLW